MDDAARLNYASVMRSGLMLVLLWCLASCATVQPVEDLKFECGDVVVVGRIKTIAAAPAQDAGVLPGWLSDYQHEIHIKRVVQGVESRRTVPATSTAHGQIRDDVDFLAVLKPDSRAGYSIRTANLWRLRPKLIGSCS